MSKVNMNYLNHIKSITKKLDNSKSFSSVSYTMAKSGHSASIRGRLEPSTLVPHYIAGVRARGQYEHTIITIKSAITHPNLVDLVVLYNSKYLYQTDVKIHPFSVNKLLTHIKNMIKKTKGGN